MGSNGFKLFRHSLAFNSRPLRLSPLAQPRTSIPYSVAPPIRISHLSTKPPLRPPGPTNQTLILAFTRGLRSALERTPVRRIVRPTQSPFGGSGGSSNGFVQQWRRRIDRMNPDHIFYAILGVNGLVFLMWGWAQENLVGTSATLSYLSQAAMVLAKVPRPRAPSVHVQALHYFLGQCPRR
jgi:hypothetical protein